MLLAGMLASLLCTRLATSSDVLIVFGNPRNRNTVLVHCGTLGSNVSDRVRAIEFVGSRCCSLDQLTDPVSSAFGLTTNYE